MSDNKEEERFQGTVVWFDPRKGYGFIGLDGQDDLFVHFSDIVSEGFRTLKKEQKVSFTMGVNKKGKPKAANVMVLQ